MAALLALALVAGLLVAGQLGGAQVERSSFDEQGGYRLIDQHGRVFDRAALARRPYVTYFGYASCPDRCPAMLLRLSALRKNLGLSPEQLPILFITVDPEHDTPERLAALVKALNIPITGLTGSQEVINRVTDNAGVFVQIIRQSDGASRIEHTTKAFVYNGQGDFSETISPQDSDRTAIRKLRYALSESEAMRTP
ncbi:SCO family protein [Novosphingobium sp.]